MENAGCGKCGVWKMGSVENFSVLTKKKRDESFHFKMRRAGMVISVVVFTNAPVCCRSSYTAGFIVPSFV